MGNLNGARGLGLVFIPPPPKPPLDARQKELLSYKYSKAKPRSFGSNSDGESVVGQTPTPAGELASTLLGDRLSRASSAATPQLAVPPVEEARSFFQDEEDRRLTLEGLSEKPLPVGKPFESEVQTKLATMVPLLQRHMEEHEPVERLAVLKFIGEEYSSRKGVKAAYDGFQDENADQLGLGWIDLSSLSKERDSKEGKWKKLLGQHNFLNHDVGPANINMRSAANLVSASNKSEIRDLARYLVTDEGTVDFAVKFVRAAKADLTPLLEGFDDRKKAQIIVDYLRKGKKKFWRDVGDRRQMSKDDILKWKEDPTSYGPAHPARLMVNPETVADAQFDQIQGWLDES